MQHSLTIGPLCVLAGHFLSCPHHHKRAILCFKLCVYYELSRWFPPGWKAFSFRLLFWFFLLLLLMAQAQSSSCYGNSKNRRINSNTEQRFRKSQEYSKAFFLFIVPRENVREPEKFQTCQVSVTFLHFQFVLRGIIHGTQQFSYRSTQVLYSTTAS